MAHVGLPEGPRGLLQRFAWRYSRRNFGHPVEPVRAAAHHGGVLVTAGLMEMTTKRWRKLDPELRFLAIHAVSASVGCSWCIDYGYFEGTHQGISAEKLRDVVRWRESTVYNDSEKAVLEYAEASTATPAHVSDNLAQRLRDHLSEPEIVELAAWIALENYRSRFNAALGLRSEGFSDRCEARPAA